MRLSIHRSCGVIGSVFLLALPALAEQDGHAFIENFPNITTTTSTVPASGDVNPHGAAVVPATAGFS
jgi:hypothetical protein